MKTSRLPVERVLNRIDNAARHMLAFKYEGELCAKLQEEFGNIFQRGEEFSPVDGGFIYKTIDDQERAILFDIKSITTIRATSERKDRTAEIRWEMKMNRTPA